MSRKKKKKKVLASKPVPWHDALMNTTGDEKEARRERYLLTRGRDWAIVKIIQGATKAATHTDRRKEKNRKACRKKVDIHTDE